MKIKRFVAKDIRLAMRMVKEELGADAVIMSNKTVDEGVEIVAAKDFDEQIIHQKLSAQTELSSELLKPEKTVELANFDAEKNNLHIISSTRKMSADGSISKRPVRRQVDQYAGYAEKIFIAGEKNKNAAQHKPLQQTPVVKPLKKEKKQQNIPGTSVSDQFMQEMRHEIQSLKADLNCKLSEVSWHQTLQNNPLRIDLLHRLADMGFSKKVALKIANNLDSHENSEIVFAKARQMLTKALPIAEDNLLEDGGIVALIGPTGVGKTTTIAKLAANYILRHGSREVALITTDNYRIGAHEQLMTYGRLLDVPVRVAKNPEELRRHISSFNNKTLVLIDTAGMSQRDMRLAEQIQTLQQQQLPIKTSLVMSATTQYKAMNEIVRAFKVFDPESTILTKLDETTQTGSALSVMIEHQQPVSFITNGQQVPEDIYIPDAKTLIEQCEIGLEQENDYTKEVNYDEWVAEGYA